jgi:pimeloyl-ACP methyl ester carboxylesterase
VQAERARLRSVWGRDEDPTALLVHGNGGHAHWTPRPSLVPGWRLVVPISAATARRLARVPAYRLDDFADDSPRSIERSRRSDRTGRPFDGRTDRARLRGATPGRVARLALLDSRLGDVDPALAARWRGRVGAPQGRGIPPGRGARRLPLRTRRARGRPDVMAPRPPRDPRARTRRLDVLRSRRAVAGRRSCRRSLSLLARVECPVLLAAGERSWVLDGAERARLTAARPGTAIEVFPGGHHFLVARPAEVGAALRRFLDALVRTR